MSAGTLTGIANMRAGASSARSPQSYEAPGDSRRAVEYYELFLEIWRDAKPDLQHYNEEARRSLTRLLGAVDEPEGLGTARFPRTLRTFSRPRNE